MSDAQGDLGLIDVVALMPAGAASSAPAGELIQLGSLSERVTALDRALEAANGYNPSDIPWNHLGLIVALMEDDGAAAAGIWVPLYDISQRVMMKITQDAIDLCAPRHGHAWYKGFTKDSPKISLNSVTVGGVLTNTIFLSVYLRDCHKLYKAWEWRVRWDEVRAHVAQRVEDGALMRQIDQELYTLKSRGCGMFPTKSAATRWRRDEIQQLLEKRGER